MKEINWGVTRIFAIAICAFCFGWWFGRDNLFNNVGRLTTGVPAGKIITEDEERPHGEYKLVKIPEYDKLQNAKGLFDLPPLFASVFRDEKVELLNDILYADDMPEDLHQWLIEGITPKAKNCGFLHSVSVNRYRSINAGAFKGRRLRFLIYPTHFLCLTRFDGPGPPSEVQVGLALTADGIKIVGYKYAEDAEPVKRGQLEIGPHMPNSSPE